MNLQNRIAWMHRLGNYMLADSEEWLAAREKAARENGWFIPEFLDLAVKNIAGSFLDKQELEKWTRQYELAAENSAPVKVGIVMAGNIPLVGFHDFLCVFISGHRAVIKPSSRDQVLIRHLTDKLLEWEPALAPFITFSEMLKNCDAYIATGSNNTSRYFEYYFGKYPNIIRRNRTSVAILDGSEKTEELEKLADDVYMYFGLGCRNVTKLYVPREYDFVPLLEAFGKYNYLADHHKYKNNYDYNLALHLLNNKYYMTNGSVLLVEDPGLFSPISQLNYEYYPDKNSLLETLSNNSDLQCMVGKGLTAWGNAQYPGLTDYADGVDTMAFLTRLN
ncbi:MAG TPA: acyl-CoA reductase [Chitinophagaceae bacterium]|nr:acyl-CoA reductase [Chitinophagaceae bacterium]